MEHLKGTYHLETENGQHSFCIKEVIVYMEGAAAVAVAAGYAVPRLFVKGKVMLPCKVIPDAGKVVVFVDEGHVQPRGAGMAMLAVYAAAHVLLWGKGAYYGIIPLLWGGFKV